MTDKTSFPSLDERQARAFLREGYIDRQTQQGTSLSTDKIEDVRMGRQDQSLTGDDAVHALQNAERLWPQVEQQIGMQQA